MTRRCQLVAVASALLFVGACSDVTAPANPRPVSHVGALTPLRSEAPPDPNEWPVTIYGTSGQVNFFDREAQVFASLNYRGSSSEILTRITLQEHSGSVISRSFPIQSEDHGFYGSASWDRYFIQGVNSSCGARIDADIEFRAWVNWINLDGEPYRLNEQTAGRSPSAQQDPCSPCTGGGGGGGGNDQDVAAIGGATLSADDPAFDCGYTGGGGGTGMNYCFTITTDYYYYVPSTGAIEYRYSTSETFCTNMA
jgi:hypothetical protein